MPPRFAYWTIIAGGLPTAFRAAERDEIMPTFQRLREKHPDAMLKWFARGKIWESPEEARADLERHRRPPDNRRREESSRFGARAPRAPRARDAGAGPPEEKRDRDWRPGGEHRDPRKKFADAKKARNASRRQQRFDRKHGPSKPPSGAPARNRFDAPRSGEPEHRHPGGPRSARPHGPKPPSNTGKPASQGGRERAPGGRERAPGGRAFERPGFERKRDARAPETQPREKPTPPPSPPRHNAPSRPPRGGPDRRDRFRRS